VVFHHVGFATGRNFRDGLVPHVLARMDSGVAIFFLISGFLLYRPFVVARLADRPPAAPRPYFRRRFLRIFPAYWAALIGISLFFGFFVNQGIVGVKGWLIHLLLLQIYDPVRFFHGISQSWTLAVEVSFYVFLPIYAWAMRRIGSAGTVRAKVRLELAGLVVLLAISIGFKAFVFWGPSSYVSKLGEYWLPANLDLFSMGMVLAVASAWIATRPETPALAARVGRIGGWWWLISVVAFWVVSTQLGLTGDINIRIVGMTAFAKQYLYGAMAFFLLLPAVFGADRGGITRTFLRFAPVAWLGLISYGIYLWHQAWILKALRWTDSIVPGALPHGPFWEVFAIVMACTIPTAALSYFLLEQPLTRLAGRAVRRESQRG
jgi:peptidoglycan/LPS O-acetylase OafA/YrhL